MDPSGAKQRTPECTCVVVNGQSCTGVGYVSHDGLLGRSSAAPTRIHAKTWVYLLSRAPEAGRLKRLAAGRAGLAAECQNLMPATGGVAGASRDSTARTPAATPVMARVRTAATFRSRPVLLVDVTFVRSDMIEPFFS